MNVEILHIDECPNWIEAGRRVQEALDRQGLSDTAVTYRLLASPEDAAAVPFAGSPTILIDGTDAFPEGARTTELACRVYRTATGFAGMPTVEALEDTIRTRSH
jgi:hypothetical protein